MKLCARSNANTTATVARMASAKPRPARAIRTVGGVAPDATVDWVARNSTSRLSASNWGSDFTGTSAEMALMFMASSLCRSGQPCIRVTAPR